MGKSGPLKAKVDRLEKKIAAKGASLDAGKRRVLHKQLKRFQRAWRTALVLEKRLAESVKGGKPAPADKPSSTAPAAATKATEEKPSGAVPAAEAAEEKPSGAAPESATPAT